MEATRRLAHMARRRALRRAAVRALGAALLIGAVAGFAAVCVFKVAGWTSPWAWPLGGGLAVAAMVGLVVAWSSRPSPLQAVAEVDRVLNTQDRLATGLLLDSAPERDTGFVAWARQEADERAETVDLSRVMRPVFGWQWRTWPVITIAAAAVGIWAPTDPFGWLTARGPGQIARATPEEVRSAAADLAAVRPDPPVIDPNAPSETEDHRHAEALREIERQLLEGKSTPRQARQQAATALESMAAEAERRSKQAAAARDALRDRLARTGAADRSGPAELRRAIRSGDAEAVRDSVERLAREAGGLSPQDRAAIAEQLEEAARQIDRPSAATGPADQPAPDVPAEAAGSDDPQRIEEALRRSGMDPAQAAARAQLLAEQNRQARAREDADRQARELSDAMRDAANELRQPAPPPSPQRKPGEPQRGPDERPSDGRSPPRDQPPQPNPASPPAGKDSNPSTTRDHAERPPSTPTPGGRPGDTPSKPSSPPSGSPPGERPADQTPAKPGDPGGGDTPKSQPSSPDAAKKPEPTPGDSPERQPTSAPSQGQPGPTQQQPGSGKSGPNPESTGSTSAAKDQQERPGNQPSAQPADNPTKSGGEKS
ncbi:MAG: hypothetical protein JNJ48_06670, partial [Phycisphaerae bacterium]|nr:hypothetical protein [Phycisphaerae bacterium]